MSIPFWITYNNTFAVSCMYYATSKLSKAYRYFTTCFTAMNFFILYNTNFPPYHQDRIYHIKIYSLHCMSGNTTRMISRALKRIPREIKQIVEMCMVCRNHRLFVYFVTNAKYPQCIIKQLTINKGNLVQSQLKKYIPLSCHYY